MIRRPPRSTPLYSSAASDVYKRQIEHMRKALELEPKRPEFHFWMGRIFLDAKKNSEAVEEWKAALELDPKYTDALEALGHAFLERNDVKKAVQYFQRALGTDPNRTAVQA